MFQGLLSVCRLPWQDDLGQLPASAVQSYAWCILVWTTFLVLLGSSELQLSWVCACEAVALTWNVCLVSCAFNAAECHKACAAAWQVVTCAPPVIKDPTNKN